MTMLNIQSRRQIIVRAKMCKVMTLALKWYKSRNQKTNAGDILQEETLKSNFLEWTRTESAFKVSSHRSPFPSHTRATDKFAFHQIAVMRNYSYYANLKIVYRGERRRDLFGNDGNEVRSGLKWSELDWIKRSCACLEREIKLFATQQD